MFDRSGQGGMVEAAVGDHGDIGAAGRLADLVLTQLQRAADGRAILRRERRQGRRCGDHPQRQAGGRDSRQAAGMHGRGHAHDPDHHASAGRPLLAGKAAIALRMTEAANPAYSCTVWAKTPRRPELPPETRHT